MSVSKSLRHRLAVQARYRCGYCQMLESISGIPLTLEHIIPQAKGGSNDEENLWLSCRLCNEAKGILTEVLDSSTNERVVLFNPRAQIWTEHFDWSEDGTFIIGRTAIGRAIVKALDLNNEFRLRTRAIWVEVGRHPPDD